MDKNLCVNGFGECDVAEHEFFLAARYKRVWPCRTCVRPINHKKKKEKENKTDNTDRIKNYILYEGDI